MSLIQEALKRQQMEQEGKLPPPSPGGDANADAPLQSTAVDGETFILPGLIPDAAATEEPQVTPAKSPLKRSSVSSAPPAPAPEASEPSDTEPEPDRKRISPTPPGEDGSDKKKTSVLSSLAAVIILLLLLAGALVWAVIYGLELAGIQLPWSTDEPVVAEQPAVDPPAIDAADAEGTVEIAVAETPTATPADDKADADVAKPARKPTIGSVVRQTVKDASADAGEANVVMADVASGTDAEPKKPATPDAEPPPAVTDAAADQPATAAAAATPAAAVPPAPIKWPDITISGVVGKEQKGAVFVNGKVIGVNETVEGIRIVAIKSQGAVLEYQGETRLAKVGQPINRGAR